MINLEVFTLSNNYIDNIQGLNNQINLRTLNINYNFITKIEGLNNLIKLEVLELKNNHIDNIQGLDNQINLKILNLSSNNISKLNGITKLSMLTHIMLHNTHTKVIDDYLQIRYCYNLTNILVDKSTIISPMITYILEYNNMKKSGRKFSITDDYMFEILTSSYLSDHTKKDIL